MEPDDEEEGDGAEESAQRKGKCVVVKTTTRQVRECIRALACHR